MASFTPSIFVTTKGLGSEAMVYYCHLSHHGYSYYNIIAVKFWLGSVAHPHSLLSTLPRCASMEVGIMLP